MNRTLPAGRPRFTRPQWAVSVAVALAAVGFMAAAQWNSSAARQQFTSSAQQILTSQAVTLQSEQEHLRDEIATAEARIREFQEADEGSRAATEQLNAQLASARLASGLAPVRGPGVVIEIADSKRVVPPGDNRNNYIVLVDDLRDIVTALWSAGAEAITINGERLVASSSIYGAGSAILVNTGTFSPPFRIEAIGREGIRDRFLNDPAYIGRVAQRIDAFALEFASQPAEELTLPGFIGSTQLRWAVPAEEPDP